MPPTVPGDSSEGAPQGTCPSVEGAAGSRAAATLLAGLFAALLAAPVPALAAVQVAVNGTVVDSTRIAGAVPAPIAGARVQVRAAEPATPPTDTALESPSAFDATVETDSLGRFRLDLPAPGAYELTFLHPRLEEVGIEELGWKRIDIGAGAPADAVLAVPSSATLYALWCGREPGEGEEAIVAARVRSGLHGGPLIGASAELEDLTGGAGALTFTGRTELDGVVLFCDVTSGRPYRLAVNAYGIQNEERTVHPSAGEVVEVDVSLNVGGEGSLRGFVQNGDSGEPVAEAAIALEGPVSRSARADADGRFGMDGLPAGTYTLQVSHIAFRDVRRQVTIPGGGRAVDVEVRVLSGAIAVDPITVEVEAGRPTWGPLVDVYDRRDQMRSLGLGRFFDRREIEQSNALRVSHLVSRVGGVRTVALPGTSTLMLHLNTNRCAPSFYLDGMPSDAELVEYSVPMTAVEAIEVYRRLSELPGEFADMNARRCGAVAVWTRRGR